MMNHGALPAEVIEEASREKRDEEKDENVDLMMEDEGPVGSDVQVVASEEASREKTDGENHSNDEWE